jgi:hypothetical protein
MAFDPLAGDARVYGNSRIFAYSSLPGEQAAQALNLEPAQEAAGAALADLAILLHAGRTQTLFLLNIFVTALAAVVLFGAARLLGVSIPAALVTAGLFGLGTQAWPYARSYFRDSLAMLFLTAAWACAFAIVSPQAASRDRRLTGLAWAGLVLALSAGILTKNTIAIAVPVLGALIVFNKFRLRLGFSLKSIPRRAWKFALIAAGVLLTFVVAWIWILPREHLLARFTPGYYVSLLQFFFGTPHPKFLEALAGPFVSPAKSLFLYSPILILAMVGLVRRWKTTWAPWAYLLLLVVGQALFYDADWWGHLNWGLRFALPALPGLMLAAAPVIERWLGSARGKAGLLLIGVPSMLVQLLGVLPPLRGYYIDLADAATPVSVSATLWSSAWSPLVWSFKWLLSGKPADLAAVRVGAASIPVVLGFLVVILLACLGLARRLRGWLPVVAACLAVGLVFSLPVVYKNDLAYFRARSDLAESQAMIAHGYRPGDLVLVKAYGTPAWFYWMDWADPRLQWTSLPFYFPASNLVAKYNALLDPEVALDEITLALFKSLPGPYRRVWLVLPDDSPGASLNLEVAWLRDHEKMKDAWIYTGAGSRTYLYLFELAPVANP